MSAKEARKLSEEANAITEEKMLIEKGYAKAIRAELKSLGFKCRTPIFSSGLLIIK